MVEVVTQQQQHSSLLFANGNRKEEAAPAAAKGGIVVGGGGGEREMEHVPVENHPLSEPSSQYYQDHDAALLASPTVVRFLKEEKESLARELQFYDVVSHVLAKIEKETREEEGEEGEEARREDESALWPEVSLLDMKKYLKSKVHSAGVSEHSTVFILEAVSTKLGRMLHSVDIYDLRQLSACTDATMHDIVAKGKSIVMSDVEDAVQDAKAVLRIIKVEKERQKGGGPAWPNLNDLNIRENTQKLAKFMWQLNPKGLVDVLARTSNADEEDVDAFQTI